MKLSSQIKPIRYLKARDLEEICDYIDRHDSPARGDNVLERIERAFQGLANHPRRGSHPRELLVIADGRRDMQTLLQRRLLQA